MNNQEIYNLILNEILKGTRFKFVLKDGTEIHGKGHVGSVAKADDNTAVLIKQDGSNQKISLGEISNVEIIDDSKSEEK